MSVIVKKYYLAIVQILYATIVSLLIQFKIIAALFNKLLTRNYSETLDKGTATGT